MRWEKGCKCQAESLKSQLYCFHIFADVKESKKRSGNFTGSILLYVLTPKKLTSWYFLTASHLFRPKKISREFKLCTSKTWILFRLHIFFIQETLSSTQMCKLKESFHMSKSALVAGCCPHPVYAVLARGLLLWCREFPSLIHAGVFGRSRKSALISFISEEARCSGSNTACISGTPALHWPTQTLNSLWASQWYKTGLGRCCCFWIYTYSTVALYQEGSGCTFLWRAMRLKRANFVDWLL